MLFYTNHYLLQILVGSKYLRLLAKKIEEKIPLFLYIEC